MVSLHCTLPCELRSGDFLEPGKPADLWECSLGFSKNSEVFLVGKTTLSINSCVHYLLGLTATLNDKLLRVLITGGTLTPNLLATLSACMHDKKMCGGRGGGIPH